MNLLQETINDIKANNITSAVVAVGSADGQYAITFDKLKDIASKTEYDDKYLTPGIADDLVMLFEDGSWFERDTDDNGVDYWRYCRKPVFTDASKTFETVSKRFDYGYTLHDVQ